MQLIDLQAIDINIWKEIKNHEGLYIMVIFRLRSNRISQFMNAFAYIWKQQRIMTQLIRNLSLCKQQCYYVGFLIFNQQVF